MTTKSLTKTKLSIFALALTLLLALFWMMSNLSAQEGGTRIVYVNSREAVASRPEWANIQALQTQAQTELGGLQDQLQVLQDKANSGQVLTTQERETGTTLQQTLIATQQRWQEDIAAATEPAVAAVQAAIEAVAQENGYDLVLDGAVAGQSGINLVVYANDSLNITQQVIERVR